MENEMNNQNWQQVAEIDLVYKSKIKPSERPVIRDSKDAFNIFLLSWDDDKIDLLEQFKILLLNRSLRVLGIYPMSTGGIGGAVADIKLIFIAALKSGASSIVLCHNHPSGCLKPSNIDLELTKKIKTAGYYLDVQVADHLIITRDNYHSMADEGEI